MKGDWRFMTSASIFGGGGVVERERVREREFRGRENQVREIESEFRELTKGEEFNSCRVSGVGFRCRLRWSGSWWWWDLAVELLPSWTFMVMEILV